MDPWNERLEIEGDAREDIRNLCPQCGEDMDDVPEGYRHGCGILEKVDIDGHYLNWCERNGIVPDMVRTGTDTDAEGEIVTVFRFA